MVPNWATQAAVAVAFVVVTAGAVVLGALTNASPWLALPGTALLIAAIVGYSTMRDRVRGARMARAATDAGFEFEASPSAVTRTRLERFPLLRRGRMRTTSNVLLGTANGLPLLIADVEFATGYGRTTRATWQTVLVLTAPKRGTPLRAADAQGWTVERSHGEWCVYREGWSATAAGLPEFVQRAAAAVGLDLSPSWPADGPSERMIEPSDL